MKVYPCGGREIMYSVRPIFTPEDSGSSQSKPHKQTERDGFRHSDAAKDSNAEAAAAASNFDRSRRRARAKVRDIALSNQFRWFVTLTLDPQKIDRYDYKKVFKTLNFWLDNNVRRRGLSYVLVPERHKDGAFHFHGLFNDALTMLDSGHTDSRGHPVCHVGQWKLGFSTAIQVYGNYAQAVSYVCKYIGKQGEKPGGRWYYAGGKLEKPTVLYGMLENWEEGFRLGSALSGLEAEAYTFTIPETGNKIGIIRNNT